jgi:acetyltransferase
VTPRHLKGIIWHAFCEGRQVLSLSESLCLLEAYKIPTVKTRVAKTAKEALDLATEIGYPVIMKAMCTQSTFKNENEKLACDVCSSSEVPLLFDQLVDKINSSNSTEFQGIAIQPKMRNNSYELFLGLRKNSKFGSIIILGTSGNSGEIIEDLTVGFPPLNQVLAKQLIEKTNLLQYANAKIVTLKLDLSRK